MEDLIRDSLAVDDLQKIRCEKAPTSVHMILLWIILGMVLDTMAEGKMVLTVVDLQKIRCEKASPSVHMILLWIILGMVLDTMAEGSLDHRWSCRG
ncbi:hypothetical protein BCR43DRAFT_496700 [Syncephalastrum racemosum]|uniref:Uncharacterized protein n=1 Tax=Syncephalastrum racemosum TaxID=13706 RepID=A0A1X2H4I5_SYNRA|nr:hypothetical protein BCR43DRAFT_496700 [Syncephalastrum racemosum]